MKAELNTLSAYSWAWAIKCGVSPNGNTVWQLCYWSAPTKQRLLQEKKPSPEAKPVRVRMITTTKLLTKKKRGSSPSRLVGF